MLSLDYRQGSLSLKIMRTYQAKIFTGIKDLVVESLIRYPHLWTLVKAKEMPDDYLIHESGVIVYVFSGSVSMGGKIATPLDQEDMDEIAYVAGQMANKNKNFMAIRDVILEIESGLLRYRQ